MRRRLRFVIGPADVEPLLGMREQDATLVTLDIDAHVRLIGAGLSPVAVYEWFDTGDHARLIDEERTLRDFWQRHASLPCGDVDALKVVGYRHLRWIARLAWVRYAVASALERLRPAEVLVPHSRPGHALDGPPEQRDMPALHALAAGIAERRCVAVMEEERPLTAPPATAAAGSPGDAEAAILAGSHVVLIGNGAELKQQAALLEAWPPDAPPPVHVYKTADRATLDWLRNRGHRPVHEAAYLGPQNETECATGGVRLAHERFDAARRGAAGVAGDVFANQRLDSHFAFLFGDYARAMGRNIAAWRAAIERRQPAMIVTSYANVALDVAAAMGVPTLNLPHGPMMLGEFDYYRTLPRTTKIGAVGGRHAALLQQAGIDPRRIVITGSPGATLQLHVSHIAPPSRPRLLLPTSHATCPALLGALPEVDPLRERAAIAALCDAAQARGWQVVIRPHPRYDHHPAYDDTLRRGRETTLRIDGRGSLAEAVAAASAVVLVSGRSSALLEATGRGRPVFVLGESAPWLDRPRWGMDAWPTCERVADLVATLERCFADVEELQRMTAASDEALRRVVGDPPAGADAAVAAILARAGDATTR